MAGFNKILVVCVGNICRSPAGERLLAAHFPNKTIASAGLGALVGHAADSTATEVAAASGVSLDGHRAQQLSAELLRDFDLVLAMEPGHVEAILKMTPEMRGRVMLFGKWLDDTAVPDPYRRSRETHEQVFQLLAQSAGLWQKKLGGRS